MKSRAWGFAALRKHIIATVHDHELHSRKSRCHLKRSYPVACIIGVIVVAVHRDIVGRKKIRIAAMIVCIFSCNVVKCHSSFHRIFVCYNALVEVYAVRQTAYAICRV